MIADDFGIPTAEAAAVDMMSDLALWYAEGIGARGDAFRTILRVFRLAAQDVTDSGADWDLNDVYTRLRACWANRPELPAVPR